MPSRPIPIPPLKPPEPSIRRGRSLTALKPHGVVLRMLERLGKPPRAN